MYTVFILLNLYIYLYCFTTFTSLDLNFLISCPINCPCYSYFFSIFFRSPPTHSSPITTILSFLSMPSCLLNCEIKRRSRKKEIYS